MAQEPRSEVDVINERLRNQPFKVAVVPLSDLELLEKNARYMSNEMFRNLVENVKRDGGLSSVPFCWKRGNKYRVLSGNHRVMAAREAGLEEVLVLYTDRDLTRSEEVAIQLSHNAIEGKDDPVILKELWDEIGDVSLKFYAGLDDKVLKELENVSLSPLAEVNLDFRLVSFLMLPEESERLKAIFAEAFKTVAAEETYLARFADFDRLMQALADTEAAHNVKNAATALTVILDVFEAHKTDLAAGWEHVEDDRNRKWVPLSSIFGTDRVPIEAAKVIRSAVDRMRGHGDIQDKSLWKAIELWAADYLAGC